MALRFAVSALWETVTGLRLLDTAGSSPSDQRWVAWARPRLLRLGADRSLLHVLVSMPVVPEFVMPVPRTRTVGFHDEVAALGRTSSARVAAAVGDDPRTRPLLVSTRETLAALADRLTAVHDAIIAPMWPRLEGVLQGDIERRGRRLVEAGAPAVLDELHPDVTSFRNRDLEVGNVRVHVGQRDLVLIPSAFVWPAVYLHNGPGLVLSDPAHGFGALWQRPNTPTEPALARLVGPTRARLLRELERPSTVSELATRLAVSVAAVSQHLTVLRAAGLVVSHRQGREVISLRTALGLAITHGEAPLLVAPKESV